MNEELVKLIDDVLPQTQCTRCGYPSCKDYAKALVADVADINQCPPGGDEGIIKLAHLLAKPVKALNPENGVIKLRQLAVIDENACIGCTLCIKACPVDAIIGANKMMHTVIADECTGCDLCIPACPVDCINMIDDLNQTWDEQRQNLARSRFESHQQRREHERQERDSRLALQAQLLKKARGAVSLENSNTKQDLIAKIMEKAQQKSN